MLMESVIDGKLQDPLEAFLEEEERKKAQEQAALEERKREKELSKKSYGESVKSIREILLKDKTKVRNSKLKDEIKEEYILVIDMLANAVEEADKDGIRYAFIAYKFAVKSKVFMFFGRAKKVARLLKDVINEL